MKPATASTSGTRTEYHHSGIVEWYESRPRSLEQGFTIAERMVGNGPLSLTLAIHGPLSPRLDADGLADLDRRLAASAKPYEEYAQAAEALLNGGSQLEERVFEIRFVAYRVGPAEHVEFRLVLEVDEWLGVEHVT